MTAQSKEIGNALEKAAGVHRNVEQLVKELKNFNSQAGNFEEISKIIERGESITETLEQIREHLEKAKEK